MEEKTTWKDRWNEELCNFIKNAFCADGDVQLVKSDKKFSTDTFFVVEDVTRGVFLVALKAQKSNPS
jgi:hypothetical protein